MYLVLGAIATSCGGLSSAIALNGYAIGMVGLGALTIFLGLRFRALFAGISQVNLAAQRLTAGKADEARDVVAAIPSFASRSGPIRRGIALVRGTAALHEGDVATAEREATAAIAGSPQILVEAPELQQRAMMEDEDDASPEEGVAMMQRPRR